MQAKNWWNSLLGLDLLLTTCSQAPETMFFDQCNFLNLRPMGLLLTVSVIFVIGLLYQCAVRSSYKLRDIIQRKISIMLTTNTNRSARN